MLHFGSLEGGGLNCLSSFSWVGTGAIRAWKIIFEIAKLLKTTIRSSRVRFWNRCSSNPLCTSEKILMKLHSYFILLLHKKWVAKILIASLHRLMHLIPRTATRIPFRAPFPTISHFIRFTLSAKERDFYWGFHCIEHLSIKFRIICICSINEAVLKHLFIFYFGIFFNKKK